MERDPVSGELDRLRRELRHRLLWEAAMWVSAFGLGFALIAGALDWLAILSPGVRALAFGAWVAGCVAVFALCRRSLASAAQGDLALARRIEAWRPRFRERAITAVELGGPVRGQPACGLRRALMESAGAELAQITAAEITDVRRRRLAAVLALTAILAAGLLVGLVPNIAFTALLRLVDPLGVHTWLSPGDRDGDNASSAGAHSSGVPPALLLHSPEIEIRMPAYTGEPPRRQRGVGRLELLRGAVCTIRAHLDRPIVRAWLAVRKNDTATRRQGEKVNVRVADRSATLPPTHLVTLSSSIEGTSFTTVLETSQLPIGDLSYTLHWENKDRLSSSVTMELQLFDDPEPHIEIARAGDREPLALLAGASIPIRIHAEDKLYGLRDVYMALQPDGERAEPALTEMQRAAALVAELAQAMQPCSRLFSALPLPTRSRAGVIHWQVTGKQWQYNLQWTPQQLGMAEGEIWSIRALAIDNRPETPGQTWSEQLQVRRITPAELDQLLADYLAQIEQQLASLRREIQTLLTMVNDADEGPHDQSRNELVDLQNAAVPLQVLLHRIGADDSSLNRIIRRIKTTLDDNSVERPVIQQQLSMLQRDLASIRDGNLHAAAAAVQDAAADLGSLNRPRRLAEAAHRMKGALSRLDEVAAAFRRSGASQRDRAARSAVEAELRKLIRDTREWEEHYRGLSDAELSAEARAAVATLLERQQRLRLRVGEWESGIGPAPSLPHSLTLSLRLAEDELRKSRGLAASTAQGSALQDLEEMRRAAESAATETAANDRDLASPPDGPTRKREPSMPSANPRNSPWNDLPPRLQEVIRQYANDRPLPEYEDEYRRYLKAITREAGK